MEHEKLMVEKPVEPKVFGISVDSLQASRARFASAQLDYVDSHSAATMLETLQGPAPFAAVSNSAALQTYRGQVDAVERTIQGDLEEVSRQRNVLRDVSHEFASAYSSSQRKSAELDAVRSEIAQLKAEISSGLPADTDGVVSRSSGPSVPMLGDKSSTEQPAAVVESRRARAAAEASASAAEREAAEAVAKSEATERAAAEAEARAGALERAAMDRASRKVSGAQQVANAKAWYEAAAAAGDRLLGVKVLEASAERVCLSVRGRGGPRRLAIGLRSTKGRGAARGGGGASSSSAAVPVATAGDPSGFGGVLRDSAPVWATLSLPGRDAEDEEATSGWLEAAVNDAEAAATSPESGASASVAPAQWVVLEVLRRI